MSDIALIIAKKAKEKMDQSKEGPEEEENPRLEAAQALIDAVKSGDAEMVLDALDMLEME